MGVVLGEGFFELQTCCAKIYKESDVHVISDNIIFCLSEMNIFQANDCF